MYKQERQRVADYMQRLYRRGLTTASGGNISSRAGHEHVLLTASKLDKAVLTGEQVGVLTLEGENLTPELPPSIETEMHLEIYRRYPRIHAIVHAHPVTATAFAASSKPINCRYIAEAYAIVGEPVVAPYARMGSPKLAQNVAAAAASGHCVLLENHGVLTLGVDLLTAFDRLELIEIAARTTLILEQLGGERELSSAQRRELDEMMGA